jgi:hypothetical protein
LDFPFYDFSVIYYDFSKLFQGVICPVLESSRGKKSIFTGWGVMCSDPHRLGGEVDFFHIILVKDRRGSLTIEFVLNGAWSFLMP